MKTKYRIVPQRDEYYIQRKEWFFWESITWASGTVMMFETLEQAEKYIRRIIYDNTPRFYYPIQQDKHLLGENDE